MWKVVILGTLASILFAGCQPSVPPTATIAADTPRPTETPVPSATPTAVPTPTSTPVPTSTPSPVPTLTPTRAGIATTECDEDFVGLSGPVEDAIDKSDELILGLTFVQAVSSPDQMKQLSDAGSELASMWNNIALDLGAQPKQVLGRVAESWRSLAKIPLTETEAMSDAYASIADALEVLAVEFEKCDATRDFANDVREKAARSQIMADFVGRGP